MVTQRTGFQIAVLFGFLALCAAGCTHGDKSECIGVTCSGHGHCNYEGGKTTCECDPGYEADGLECIASCGSDAECAAYGETFWCNPRTQECEDACSDQECGPSAVTDLDCGSCDEHDRCDDQGQCVLGCDTHGQCEFLGSTFACHPDTSVCEDACAGLECGLSHFAELDCGACSPIAPHCSPMGQCNPMPASCDDVTCSGHGSCFVNMDETAQCDCDEGYDGMVCKQCANRYQDHDADGTCLPDCSESVLQCAPGGVCSDLSGQANCICDTAYTGAQCTQCAEGYQDNDLDSVCEMDCSLANLECPVHGHCDDGSGSPECVCESGYAGELCEVCAAGYQDNDGNKTCSVTCEASNRDCREHGHCEDSSGSVRCVCDPGYDGFYCHECSDDHQDNDSNGTCLPSCDYPGYTCGPYATCEDQTGAIECVCIEGHTGLTCAVCGLGYQDKDSDGWCLPDCGNRDQACTPNGYCDDASGVARCVCDKWWGGPDCAVALAHFDWIPIDGGTFEMGRDGVYDNTQPVHTVTVGAFEINRTEVTVAQYTQCVESGDCSETHEHGNVPLCNYQGAGLEDHPINCESWHQAVDFCAWAGGRLPTESEWEYAARSGGLDIIYPWGDSQADCTFAVFNDDASGCGDERTWPVCSKTAGNTEHDLCDMSGNVAEWVQDTYHGSYNCDENPDATNCQRGGLAPDDGSAWEDKDSERRVYRGGEYYIYPYYIRVHSRRSGIDAYSGPGMGFRCAR